MLANLSEAANMAGGQQKVTNQLWATSEAHTEVTHRLFSHPLGVGGRAAADGSESVALLPGSVMLQEELQLRPAPSRGMASWDRSIQMHCVA